MRLRTQTACEGKTFLFISNNYLLVAVAVAVAVATQFIIFDIYQMTLI